MSEDQKPDYMGNPQHFLSTLLCVSLPTLYGGDRFRMEAVKMDDKALLKAIKHQAEQSQDSVRWLLSSMGTCIAVACESKEMPREALVSLGWGINFISDLDEGLEQVRSTAEYWLNEVSE